MSAEWLSGVAEALADWPRDGRDGERYRRVGTTHAPNRASAFLAEPPEPPHVYEMWRTVPAGDTEPYGEYEDHRPLTPELVREWLARWGEDCQVLTVRADAGDCVIARIIYRGEHETLRYSEVKP